MFVLSIGIMIFNGSLEQALKSGQLPVDFKLSDDNSRSTSIQETDGSTVLTSENNADGAGDVEEQGKDEPAPMEQVLIRLAVTSKLLVFIFSLFHSSFCVPLLEVRVHSDFVISISSLNEIPWKIFESDMS